MAARFLEFHPLSRAGAVDFFSTVSLPLRTSWLKVGIFLHLLIVYSQTAVSPVDSYFRQLFGQNTAQCHRVPILPNASKGCQVIFWRFRRSLQFVFGQGAGLGGIWEFLCPQGPFLCWRFSSAEEKRAALGQRRPRGGEQVWISKTAPRDLARGDFYFSLFTASDSRHNSSPGTTLSRGAAGRVCLRAPARRKIAPATWQGAISTFRLLLLPTPGTTQVPAQPLGAERRGGSAGGRQPAIFCWLGSG